MKGSRWAGLRAPCFSTMAHSWCLILPSLNTKPCCCLLLFVTILVFSFLFVFLVVLHLYVPSCSFAIHSSSLLWVYLVIVCLLAPLLCNTMSVFPTLPQSPCSFLLLAPCCSPKLRYDKEVSKCECKNEIRFESL